MRTLVLGLSAVTLAAAALAACSPKGGATSASAPGSDAAPASAAAPAAWPTYTNADFGIAIDTPTPPVIKSGVVPSDIGPTPQLMGTVTLPGDTTMNFGVQDYGKLDMNEKASLDHAVKGGIDKMHLIVDKLDNITVQGVPGREIEGHLGDFKLKSRVVVFHKRIITLAAIAHAATGIPAEYDRMESSMKLN